MEVLEKTVVLAILVFAVSVPLAASAQTEPFNQWLQSVTEEALAEGVSPGTVSRALSDVWPDEDVVELDRKQPETTVTFASYLKNTVTPMRIHQGRELMHEHAPLLQTLHEQYGVPPSITVALWGMESSFGQNTGHYDVINSLVTLAYEGRRAAFFRKELIEALRILDEEGIDKSLLAGSWAGAMGQSQFMPSTFRRFAVDHDRDGRRDIWESDADVLASIANYLAAEGWQRDMKWGREVRVPERVQERYTGLETRLALDEWNRLGVRTMDGHALPSLPLNASLVRPDGQGGRSFLVYDNFRALMRWNRSTYFATAIGLFAESMAMSH